MRRARLLNMKTAKTCLKYKIKKALGVIGMHFKESSLRLFVIVMTAETILLFVRRFIVDRTQPEHSLGTSRIMETQSSR